MKEFAAKNSIVRKIWGNSDTVLLIFAGASAEFALNKSVDWLYFTGKLPSDPLGRLFSTVTYAQKIVFGGSAQSINIEDNIFESFVTSSSGNNASHIYANSSVGENRTIRNNTFTGGGGYAIYLNGGGNKTGLEITGNSFTNTYNGIHVGYYDNIISYYKLL